MKKLIIYSLCFYFCSTTLSFAQYRVKNQPIRMTDANAGYSFMSPQWSPDGAKIAVTSDRYNGIWIIPADGSGMFQLTDDGSAGYGFQWSADSRAIVSRIAQFDGPYRYNAVKVYDVTTGEGKLVSDLRQSMSGLPRWADDDKTVFIFTDGVLDVFDTGRNSSSLKRGRVSPEIFFLKDDHIGSANIKTKNIKDIVPITDEIYLNLILSPDKTRMVFEVMSGNMHVMNTDGTGLIDLGTGFRPQWSPDSQHLVYMVTKDDGHQYISADLQIINIHTKEISKLTFEPDKLEMNPSWSPQGDKIAFDVLDEGTIYVAELTR